MGRRRLTISRQFLSATERLSWADQDIAELKTTAHAFFAADTHERASELDADGISYFDKIRFRATFPPRVAKLTVSAIENLRSALDHGACAVVPRDARKRTYFPFGDTKAEFNRHLKSKAKFVPDEIKAIFVRLKPYKAGNPALWALNKIANTHKHRSIVRPGVDVKRVSFVGNPGLDAILAHSQPRWDRRKNEIVIARVSGETTRQHDVDALLGVAFGKVPIFAGKPVLAVLRYLAHRIYNILYLMESEAVRIGIIK